MKPFETIVATNVVKGADLPTYAEVKALVDDLEYKRTHSGSLLHERTGDITITTSGLFKSTKFKFFDGVKDNFAGWVVDNPDNFIEFNVTKVKPNLDKIVLGGFKIEDARLLLRFGEELVAPAAETKVEEYAKTFILPEKVTPDAIRFEFDGKKVEIYELEAF